MTSFIDADIAQCRAFFPGLKWVPLSKTELNQVGAVSGVRSEPLGVADNSLKGQAAYIFLFSLPMHNGTNAYFAHSGKMALRVEAQLTVANALKEMRFQLSKAAELHSWLEKATSAEAKIIEFCNFLLPGLEWKYSGGPIVLTGAERQLPYEGAEPLKVEVHLSKTQTFVPILFCADAPLISHLVENQIEEALRQLCSQTRKLPAIYRRLKQLLPHTRVPLRQEEFRRWALERLLCCEEYTIWIDDELHDPMELIAYYDLTAVGVATCFDTHFTDGRRGFRINPSQLKNAQSLLSEMLVEVTANQ